MSKVIVSQIELTYHKINHQNDPQTFHPVQHTL